MNVSKYVWTKCIPLALAATTLWTYADESQAYAESSLRQAGDQELNFSFGYSQYGNFGFAYGLHLAPQHQVEVGAGIGIIDGVVSGVYKYYFNPEQKLASYAQVGVANYKLFGPRVVLGGGLHYLITDSLTLGASVGTIPGDDDETLFSCELLRLGLRW